ncbi:hypothetical protein MP228_000550 [Amoeboaphelidium protococcarum]|nr:hypothetical protein MP228_000550 [Amoeboaphelidium protococcarum]
MSVEQQQSSCLEHKSYPWVVLYLVGLLFKAYYILDRVRNHVENQIVYALWLYRFYLLPVEQFTKVPRHVAILLDDGDDYTYDYSEEFSKCRDLKRLGRPVSTHELVALQQWLARMLVSSVDLYGYRQSSPSSFQIEGQKCTDFLKFQPLYAKVEQDVKEYDMIIVLTPKSSVLRLSGLQPLSARQSEIIHFPFQSQIDEFVLYRSMYLYNRKEQRHGK